MENPYFNLQSGNDIRTVAQLQAYNTWLLQRSVTDLPLCLGRDPINDPRSHMWRGVAADLINAAAFFSIRKAQVLGCPEDNVISLGLSCLRIALSMLLAIHRVFSEIGYDTASRPQNVQRNIGCDDISQLRPRLDGFLQAMHEVALNPPFLEEVANHLTNLYGVLILFLIRCTLRSAFQCHNDYQAVEGQRNQDNFFVQGSACPACERLYPGNQIALLRLAEFHYTILLPMNLS